MSKMFMINNLKELFPNYIVMVKVGTFYEVYYDDAKIISNLFNYKLKNIYDNIPNCGFPTVSINKILYILDNKKINYLVCDKKDNYNELNKNNFKNKNNYNQIKEKCLKEIDIKNRIRMINEFLLNDSSKINEVEKIIYA